MKTRFFLVFLFASNLCYSQTPVDVRYEDKEGNKCSSQNAYYVTTVSFNSDYTKLIRTKKTIDDLIIAEHELSEQNPDILDGKFTLYFEENGSLKAEGNYERYRASGRWKTYYLNGTLKKEFDYGIPQNKDAKYRILQVIDTLGKQTVSDGEGFYVEHLGVDVIDDDTKASGYLSGYLSKGLKNGIWEGMEFESKDVFEEHWRSGKFLSGIRTDTLGEIYEYTKLEVFPEPNGGMQSFYQYIGKNLRYPNDARKNGVEGKVFIEFKVDEKGNLIEKKIVKGIGFGCDEEVLRVMEKAPMWKNGIYRGKPVKVKMVLPLTFKLG